MKCPITSLEFRRGRLAVFLHDAIERVFLRATCLSAASMLDFFFVGFGIMFLLLLPSLALQVFLTNGPKDVGSDFISRPD